MKITLITSGSRGDVEPYVALAEGLRDSGHIVTIATEKRFEPFILEHGLIFFAIPGDTYAAINSPEGHKALNKKNNTEAFFNHLTNASAPMAADIVWQCLAACKNADHIICTHFSLHTAYFLSQQLSIPFSMASVNPMVGCATNEFHNMMFPPALDWLPVSIAKWYNLFSHKTVSELWWKSYKRIYTAGWKTACGLNLPSKDPLKTAKPPLSLFGYSPNVLKKPKDWGSHQHVCGYWFLKANDDWSPPPGLEAFINDGPAPIYIGFGSMNNSMLKNGALEKLVLATIAQTKHRFVILKQGLNFEPGKIADNIFATGPVPFKYLFPKMRLLVHHGGAGTTALGLRAGIPSVLTPLIVDQRFWAWRVEKLHVGPAPLYWHSLTAPKLSSAINTWADNNSAKNRAFELGKKIEQEDGVATAVRIFNESV
jgi:sterol 3beta-glucosyltransferase